MLKKISHYGISSIYNSVLGILSIIILTKFYTLIDFGKIAIFILIGNILGNILTFGLGGATIRFYFESLKKNNFNSFRILNYSNFIIILIIFFLSLIIIYYLQNFFIQIIEFEITSNFLLISYFYGFLNTIYHYFLNLLIAQKKSKNYLYFSIFYSTLNIFLTIFLIFFYQDNYVSRIYSLLVVNFVLSIIIFIYLFETLKIKFSVKSIFKSLKFSLPGYPSTLMGVVHNNFDKSFLTLVKDIGALGVLDISNRIGLMSKMFIDFVIQAWIPEFMTNANKNKKKKIILNYNQIIYYFSIFILCLSFFSEEIIIILTSEEFFIAKYYVPLICLSVFINHSFTLISKPSITYAKKLQKLI
jgi:O-antigen/teichoic acid export membrane protein